MSESMSQMSEGPTAPPLKSGRNRAIKWIAGISGVILGALLTVALVVPLVVNVDQYRPKIVEVAQNYINGKVEMGPLSLSLWGRIEVRMQGLKISDDQGQAVIQVADAGFHFPFAALLAGKPVLTFRMLQPQITAIRGADGQLNLLKLPRLPKTAESGASDTATRPSEGTQDSPTVKLPGVVLAARLGTRIEDAKLIVKDTATQASSEVDHLNFELKNASLSDIAELSVWGDLAARMGSQLSVSGPFRVDASVTPRVDAQGGKFLNADLEANGQFSDLRMEMPGLFVKESGVPTRFSMKMNVSPSLVKMDAVDFQFFNAEVKTGGTVTLPSGEGQSPIVDYRVRSNAIDFSGWSKLIPMLKEYELKGSGSLQAEVKGPTDRIQYQVELAAKDLSARAPQLKATPVMQFSMKVVTDQIEELLFSMKAPGNDLNVKGKVISFSTPRADFSVTSTGLDFDQLLVLPPLQSKTAEAKPAKEESDAKLTPGTGGAKQADYDAMLEPVRSNEMLQRISAVVDMNLQFIQVYGVKMSGVRARMSFKNGIGALEKAAMGLWDGQFKADMNFDLKPKIPTYRFAMGVDGLSLQKAVDSQFQLFRNTLLGQAFFSLQGSGSSFNPTPAQKNLDAKGSWQVKNATFATADIGKVAVDAINGAIGKIAAQFPEIKEKMLKAPSSRESGYESMGATFSISKGVFLMPDFNAKAKPNAGVDVRGSTEVVLAEGYPIKAKWEIIDTHNFTRARDISIQQAGVRIESLFSEGSQPVRFPVTVGCKAVEPCFSYTEVPQYLAGVALSKITKAASQKIEAEVRKKAESVVQDLEKKAAPEVNKALQKLKGLF